MSRGLSRRVLSFVSLGLAGFSLSALAGGGDGPAPQQGREALASLQCESDDELRLSVLTTVGDDVPGGTTSASDGLQAFLAQDYPWLPAGEFRSVAQDTNAVQYVLEENGARRASAYLEPHGDSWYVTGFVACGNSSRESQGGGDQ